MNLKKVSKMFMAMGLCGVILCSNGLSASAAMTNTGWVNYNTTGQLKYRLYKNYSNMVTMNDETTWPTYIYAGTETNMVAEQQSTVSAFRCRNDKGEIYDTVARKSSDYIEEGQSTGCAISSGSGFFFANDNRTYKILSKNPTYGVTQYKK